MKKQIPIFGAVFVFLTALALYLAQGAMRRGGAVIVLLFAAVLFWKRAQKSL